MSVLMQVMSSALTQIGIDTQSAPANKRPHRYFAIPYNGGAILARVANTLEGETAQLIGLPPREFRSAGVNPLEVAALSDVTPLVQGTYGFDRVEYVAR